MSKRDDAKATQLTMMLDSYQESVAPLPGIHFDENKYCLVRQMVDSIRRIDYVKVLNSREHSALRADPKSEIFDPIRAAVISLNLGDVDEASWLIFLAIHFGKHKADGWALARQFYGALGQGFIWDWKRARFDPDSMIDWLSINSQSFASRGFRFGNHRKYETMDPSKRGFTGAVLKSYVLWVAEHEDHQKLFTAALNSNNLNSRAAFDTLYRSMDQVLRFGRTAKFDYLTMIAKVGVADIEAGSTYMSQATGPYLGANLLFTGATKGDMTRREADKMLIELDLHLQVGMQVLEDALCNWQKSPNNYMYFRG